MNETRRQKILTMFTNVPFVSTDQIARYFPDNAQPLKRASWALCQLEDERLIEGHNRGLAGLTKVWRLSKKGRAVCGLDFIRAARPFNHRVPHFLEIANVWQHLSETVNLTRWRMELREKYTGGDTPFSADIFFAYRTAGGTRFWFVEVERGTKTSNGWAARWGKYSGFMGSKSFERASFQDFKNAKGEHVTIVSSKFQILVISNQMEKTIKGGSSLPITIVNDIKEAPLF